MNRRRIFTATVVLLLGLSFPAYAQDRPQIGVAFSLAPPYDFFNAERRAFIESEVTGRIVTALQAAYPVYTFRAGFSADAQGRHRLAIKLADDPRAGGGPIPGVVFIVSLDAHRGDGPVLYVPYRSAERRGEPVPRFETFARELADRFVAEIEQNRHGFMTTLFQRIVLASDAFPLPANRAFVLPFAAGEFADGTQFAITTRDAAATTWEMQAVPDGEAPAGTDLPPQYHRRLRARVQSPADALQLLISGQPLTPQTIRLLAYNRGAAAIPAEPPSAFRPSRGDGR